MTGCRISKITMTEHQAHDWAAYFKPGENKVVLDAIYNGTYGIELRCGEITPVRLIRDSERGFCSLIEEEWKIERQNAELERAEYG